MNDTRPHARGPAAGRVIRWLPLLAAAGLGGCAFIDHLRPHAEVTPPPARTTPVAAAPGVAGAPATGELSLSRIISQLLEHGRYADGEHALRRYLEHHPGDRFAQSLLHQLTVDPRAELGPSGPPHVVRPGDSYSTLAAHYLGDARLFLLLARYNGADDPSLLQVGQTVRVPADTAHAAGRSPEAPAATAVAPPPAAAAEPEESKARRLERESLALLKHGDRQAALARMDEALAADPSLTLDGDGARALRDQLVGAYHQRAIVLYRDQQLEQAISLWNHVLAIRPGYEPAIVYRARALELQRRLKQF